MNRALEQHDTLSSGKHSLIVSRYQVVDMLSQSTTTALYRARDTVDFSDGGKERETVVLKVINCSARNGKQLASHLRLEARLMQVSRHRHVVSMYEYGEDCGRCYIVMEDAAEGNVRQLLQKQVTLSVRKSLSILCQALAGLEAIHSAAVVHGDLRPETLLLADNETIKIGDFRTPSLIRAGERRSWIGGQIDYSAPEILLADSYSVAGDIYSLGVILYELLTGTLPFAGTVTAQLESKRLGFIAPLKQIPAELQCAFECIILKALAVNPKERFSSAGQFRRTLEQVAGLIS